ncbi:hypothetical protein NDU88_001812 [Pleurodeles waltl]|uniref:BTB domain-containing protein n=1 Tax=Pleurodeles waltl TaxID=8319 RepID=A0AAV7NLA2_PLEWA|nr:hypothetical protein NDU88_001812 [Pleurodeles waltl]
MTPKFLTFLTGVGRVLIYCGDQIGDQKEMSLPNRRTSVFPEVKAMNMAHQRESANRVLSNGVPQNKSTFLVAEGHGQHILNVLQSFRDQNMFFDFNIFVKDEVFPCHRCVIAACSDFFRAMFEVNMKERDDGTVTLSNLSPQAVKVVKLKALTISKASWMLNRTVLSQNNGNP